MPSTSDITETFGTAHGFLDALRPYDERWLAVGDASTWLFRGHMDAEWALLPSAWRQTARKALAAHFDFWDPLVPAPNAPRDKINEQAAEWQSRARSCMVQARVELEIVRDFVRLAADLGHAVPAESFSNWEEYCKEGELSPSRLRSRRLFVAANWYPSDPVPPMLSTALAQHHGIPTRLLDWTWRPWVAAFFAADELVHCAADVRPSQMAVWAVNKRFLEMNGRFSVLECPRRDMQYLHAQDAVLTSDLDANRHFMETGEWPTLDGVLLGIEGPPAQAVLRRLVLPATEATSLLDLLWSARVSRAHLMPALDHVAKVALERLKPGSPLTL